MTRGNEFREFSGFFRAIRRFAQFVLKNRTLRRLWRFARNPADGRRGNDRIASEAV
jgi:hypothetical protein